MVCVSGGLGDMFNVTCFIGVITESNERLNFSVGYSSESVLKNCFDYQKNEYEFSLFPLNTDTVFISCSTKSGLIYNLLTPQNDHFKTLSSSFSIIYYSEGNFY